MEELHYLDYIEEATERLEKGAFLTTKVKGETNTMTIGWGSIGYIWSKPMFSVLVRESRHTYQLIENSDEFTVSIPLTDKLKSALAFCGSKSGADYDKFKECDLTARPGQEVDVPIIGECELHYECKIVFQQEMEKDNLIAEYQTNNYPGNDYHTIYYGEILTSYLL